MSGASPFRADSVDTERTDVQSLRGVIEPVRAVGFWSAVVLPFAVIGLLAAGFAQQFPLLLGVLLVANVAALVLGRDYNR